MSRLVTDYLTKIADDYDQEATLTRMGAKHPYLTSAAAAAIPYAKAVAPMTNMVPDGAGIGYFGRQLGGKLLGGMAGGMAHPALRYPGAVLGGAGWSGEYLDRAHRKAQRQAPGAFLERAQREAKVAGEYDPERRLTQIGAEHPYLASAVASTIPLGTIFAPMTELVPDGAGWGYFGRQFAGTLLGGMVGGALHPHLTIPAAIAGGAGLSGEYLESAHKKARKRATDAPKVAGERVLRRPSLWGH
jgi:hypothetical protein